VPASADACEKVLGPTGRDLGHLQVVGESLVLAYGAGIERATVQARRAERAPDRLGVRSLRAIGVRPVGTENLIRPARATIWYF
jgi:hypothetical protein